jgi:tRNA U38,U39,U40 pseudouridine synthase TruA
VLAQAGGEPEHLDELTRFRLAVWYFEDRLGGRIPDDIEAYSVAHGHADADAFYHALWREYRYVINGAAGEPDAPGTAADRPAER